MLRISSGKSTGRIGSTGDIRDLDAGLTRHYTHHIEALEGTMQVEQKPYRSS